MVRLVFRPYTQVWRTICTSVTLRASTRVSPGFTLLKRSSPSFGSYQICSCSIPSFENQGWPVLRLLRFTPYTRFRCAFRFNTLRLAYGVDSLVRVSRRVSRSLFYTISKRTLRLEYSTLDELRPSRTQAFHPHFLHSNLIVYLHNKNCPSFSSCNNGPMKYLKPQR